MRNSIKCLLIVLITGFFAWPAHAGLIYTQAPETPDPQARYLFYMHGMWLEDNLPDKPNKKYGTYRYRDILDTFAKLGYTVISELRPRGTRPKRYAMKIIAQVERLIAGGVPPANIVVTGFSKGGQITLLVAALNMRPNLRFVVMAGCGKGRFRGGYKKFLRRDAASMIGRMLSIYDASDQATGTCREAFDEAPGLIAGEEVLHVGRGHGTFYTANPDWVNMVAAWLK